MKKILSLLLAILMMGSLVAVFTSCGEEKDEFKVGFIFLHDENSTYDKNFMDAATEATKALELDQETQVFFKVNIPEGQECYEAAKELANLGCDVIFADSFGHEDYMIQAAEEFPEVEFCHATGTKAHTSDLANFHNAFASIYEGRFLAGIVAGMKMNEMIADGKFTAEEAKMGYVGAMPYAEVKSGLTAFYLGAKSVCPTVTMDVKYTNSWYDMTKEQEAANALMDGGAKLISQHADSMGAPNACEARNVPNVAYNGSTVSACPNTALISSRINWAPYFKYMIEKAQAGEAIADDYTGTLKDGSVELTALNTDAAAEGTQAAIDAAKAKLIAGELKVFATDTFTVKGNAVTTYKADVDTDAAFTGDTEVIADGYFHESEYRSAPYFDLDIDGITTIQ
ncbi:MAG: BMP family ABC transporter substrate-binding protein [Clostridia bacterium]|nr:BMP family ABC transporter substrate-binding protein [Clostridia bacterium]